MTGRAASQNLEADHSRCPLMGTRTGSFSSGPVLQTVLETQSCGEDVLAGVYRCRLHRLFRTLTTITAAISSSSGPQAKNSSTAI